MQTDTKLILLRSDFLRQRHTVFDEFREQPNANLLLDSLRRLVDKTIITITEIYPLPLQCTLAAIGGYGRGELYPHSDIDVLLLLEDTPTEQDEQQIHQFLGALWDCGLEVSQSVRTLVQAIEDANSDITIQTSLLESRLLVGTRKHLRRLKQSLALRLNPHAFFIAKKAEMHQRHARYNHTPYALEPNCKESPGGLRDIQVILWMCRAANLGKTWQHLLQQHLLDETEVQQLEKAHAAFKRLRIELHLLCKRREDRVLFEHQIQLAIRYGLEDRQGKRASEHLMQRYYWAAKLVSQLTRMVLQHIEERLFSDDLPIKRINDFFCEQRGLLAFNPGVSIHQRPSLLLEAFLCLQQHPELKGFSAQTTRNLWQARDLITEEFRQHPHHQVLFLSLFKQARGVIHELRRMNDLGILERYLPAFRSTIGQMQHDLYHVYTVDQHILMVIRQLRRFSMPEHADMHPRCHPLMLTFNQPWLLYIAALFHDIGKGRGGDHSHIGALEIAQFADQHGLSEEDKKLLIFLVKEHLLLSHTAQKLDLSDPHVIQAFADKVKHKRYLMALYLLTIADIQATNPKLWNSWREKLLDELYKKAMAHLSHQQEQDESIDIITERKINVLNTLGNSPDIPRLWEQLGEAYFLRYDEEEIGWHTTCLQPYSHTLQGRNYVGLRTLSSPDMVEIFIMCQDQATLFLKVCAYLFFKQSNILAAKAYTGPNGLILNTYHVQFQSRPQITTQTLTSIKSELYQILESPLQCPEKIERLTSKRARFFPLQIQVDISPPNDKHQALVSLLAMDKPGLLFRIAHVFFEHQVQIVNAKIVTLADRVEDTFLIQSDILRDDNHRRRLEQALFFALSH